jgi:regulator of replication initiation timing
MSNIIIDKVASIYKLASTLGNSDLLLQISDLKTELSAIYDENRRLKEELRNLKEHVKKPLVFNTEDRLYYKEDDDTPFCPKCFEAHKLEMHLRDYTCPECKEYYGKKFEISRMKNVYH